MKYLVIPALFLLSACSHKAKPALIYTCINPFFVLQSVQIDTSSEHVKDLGAYLQVDTEQGVPVMISKTLCAVMPKAGE